jgi:anti-sigma regulatory factor (Ser/Thr protein kinase)
MGSKSKDTAMKRLVIPADAKYLVKVRDFAVKFGKKNGVTQKDINGLRISIDEICSNIVLYAYKGRNRGDIQIELERKKDLLVVNIIDTGIEFDYATIEKPDLHKFVFEGKRGGFGFHLVKKLNDDVIYKRVGDQNIVTIKKIIEPKKTFFKR